MAIEVLPNMEVDRTLPHAELDGTDIDPRLSRYRELMVIPSTLTKHPLPDEGTYFTANNAQTGLATAAAPTAFSATNPFLIIYNASNPSDDFAKRLYLDYIMLMSTAAGTAATSVQFVITRDTGNRFTSGGTDLTPNIVNLGPTSTASPTRVYAGNLTAAAASSVVKTLVGNRTMKSATAPAPTALDQYTIRCGSTSSPDLLSLGGTQTMSTCNIPPIVLGPNESLLLHLFLPAQSAASSFAPEVGWWER